jgi:hypothetical protein
MTATLPRRLGLARWAVIALGFAVAPLLAADDKAQPLSPDLALVPPDAIGFAHVRVAEMWRGELFRGIRETVEKAGPQAIQAFDRRFAPVSSSLDRVTAFLLPPEPGGNEPVPVVIFRTSKPFDPDKLVESLVPNAQPHPIEGGRYFTDVQSDVGLRVIDRQTFLIAPAKAPAKVFAVSPAKATGPLGTALAQAGTHKLTVAANTTLFPPGAVAQVPPPLQPLARAELFTLTADVASDVQFDLRVQYADADAAADAEKAARNGLEMARQQLGVARAELEKRLLAPSDGPAKISELPEAAAMLFGLGAIGQYDEILRTLPLQRQDNRLRLAMTVPIGNATTGVFATSMMVGMALPAVQKVRESGSGARAQNNLKQIALALHNYNDAYQGQLPAHAIYSKDGKKPLLSWRVAILPYVEQDALYREFHLDEPWDSEHNKKLIPKMPQVYLAPNAPPAKEPGLTHYQVFVGGGAVWERGPQHPGLPRTFVDGTSNTIMVAEAAEPVIWTKPDDLTYDPAKPLPKLGADPASPTFIVVMGDGSTRRVSRKALEKNLRAAITAAGNEVLPRDWDQ